MSYLKSQPDDTVLLNIFKAFPRTAKPLLEYHEALLRGPSPLSEGERELIAAVVSSVNACNYCSGVHRAVAESFGISSDVLNQVVEDLDSAAVEEKLKPILSYVKKLTVSPSKVTEQDVAAIYAAGWDDKAIHDAVSVCALFNFMNRLVEGLGLEAGPEYFKFGAERLVKNGYGALAKMLDSES